MVMMMMTITYYGTTTKIRLQPGLVAVSIACEL